VEGSGRVLILRNNPVICLEGLRKTTKNFSQYSCYLGRDMNPGSPEYEAGVLATRPRRSDFCDIEKWRACKGADLCPC
jgi:hypothetical protein